ncbi:MAG: GNAT family N-acetyltransferase [Lachnospiraceae bacterium]|jgi:GNAT superfamily N-acetyltransferase|nr:GNAT family N-acetyltransferase [Lachnospiraceae bacterium]
MIFEINQTEKAASLFEGWQESVIWSCLQNVMGNLYADEKESPSSAMIFLGDFGFPAGKPNKEIIMDGPAMYWRNGRTARGGEGREDGEADRMEGIIVPQNEAWADLIEESYGKRAKKVIRYAIKKEPGIFDKDKLQAVVDGIPEGYVLKMIDEELFHYCGRTKWCRDWVSNYRDYPMYQKYGLGAVILKEGEPVSGASSYSGFRGGIEVEIDTREDYRRKGLAHVCGAKLILECLVRDWYPSWDAQNKWSAALAEKLGYHFSHEYTAYEIYTQELL